MNELKIFENPQFGKIRVIDGMFVAADVSDALNYRTASDMTRRLDDSDKGYANVRTLGGEQEMIVISESGLYDAIFRSNADRAKPFRKWVTSEVIPSIRKHGAYMTPDMLETAIANPDYMIGLLQNLKEERLKRIEAETTIQVLEPKAEFYDAVAGSRTAIDIGNAAKVLGITGIGRNRLFEILRDQGVLDNSNIPYQTYIDRGYFRVIEQTFTKPNGEKQISFKTLVFQRGLDYIRKMLQKRAVS